MIQDPRKRWNVGVLFTTMRLYGTLDCVNVAEVECGVIWTKHGTYTMLTPNTLYHTIIPYTEQKKDDIPLALNKDN